MIKNFGEFLEKFTYYLDHILIDKAHASLVFSTAISSKPENILEIGIGSGLVTYTLLHACYYNGKGKITAVDNWSQWGPDGIQPSTRPPEIKNLEKYGVNVIESQEREFVESCKEKYDLVVIDGDHTNGHLWADKIFDLVSPGGILFSHDVCLYPNLGKYMDLAKEKGLSYKVFNKSSRPGERCERGFIVVYK